MVMNMSVEEIVEVSRALPQSQQAELVDRILLTMHGGQEPDQAKAWSDRVHQRVEEIRSGLAKGVPGEETAAKIRRIVSYA